MIFLQRITNTLLLSLFAVMFTGCSFVFMKRPPSVMPGVPASESQVVKCTESAGFSIADTIVGPFVVGIGVAVALLANQQQAYVHPEPFYAIGALTAAGGVTMSVSGVLGKEWSKKCISFRESQGQSANALNPGLNYVPIGGE